MWMSGLSNTLLTLAYIFLYPMVMIHGWLGNSLLSLINYIYIYLFIHILDVMISILLCFYVPALMTGGYMDVNCEDV